MKTRIVTDSTCDLPAGLIQELGIIVIPNYINFGEISYLDGLEMTHEDFYRDLVVNPVHPKTSSPGSGLFEEAYRRLVAEGADQIISIHIHTGLSNLSNSARMAAETIEGARVTVLEVGQVAMGLGFMVFSAAEAALNGRPADEIVHLIKDQDSRTITFAALDTLEYLRDSGRAPALVVGIANLLQIKPIIQLHQGILRVTGRVRTSTGSIDWLVKRIREIGRLDKLAVLHTNALEKAQKLRERLCSLLPGSIEIKITEATPTLGVHVGPRAVGLALVKSRDI